jgi:hypothetical protein
MHRAAHRSLGGAPRYLGLIVPLRGTALTPQASSMPKRCAQIRWPSPNRLSRKSLQQRVGLMTLTVAHITPIMSLIAGVLILLMPRLLNFIVAIFLILNGLIGLGLLRWLHV